MSLSYEKYKADCNKLGFEPVEIGKCDKWEKNNDN